MLCRLEATSPFVFSTVNERSILRFIERYQNRFGRTPSYEEIREGTGMSSKDHVYRDVKTLEERKYLCRERGISRGITEFAKLYSPKANGTPSGGKDKKATRSKS